MSLKTKNYIFEIIFFVSKKREFYDIFKIPLKLITLSWANVERNFQS